MILSVPDQAEAEIQIVQKLNLENPKDLREARWEAVAAAHTIHQADTAKDLPILTQLLDRVLLATLPGAIAHLLNRLQAVAAVANDITHLMNALPSLVNCIRYRDVRQTDASGLLLLHDDDIW